MALSHKANHRFKIEYELWRLSTEQYVSRINAMQDKL